MPQVVFGPAVRGLLASLPRARRALAHDMIMDIATGKDVDATPYAGIPGASRLERGALTMFYRYDEAAGEVDLLVVRVDS